MLWILFVVIAFGVAGTLALAWAKQRQVVTTRLAAILTCTVFAVTIGYFSGPIALNAAQTGAVSGYQQDLNGTIVDTTVTPYTCTKDGPCDHEYNCESYQVQTSAAYTDNNGHHHPAQYTTYYHHCPVATMEYTYTIFYSTHPDGSHVKTMVLVDHGFAANPKPWCCTYDPDGDSSIPTDVPRGVPAAWTKAKHDLAVGNSDWVTVQDSYENYILANESTILRTYSSDIGRLKRSHLMPPGPLTPIHDFYLANKVNFVRLPMSSSEQAAWQDAIGHLNAALGTELEGDMHVVAVNADALQGVISPDAYANAIQADWLNDYQKSAMAKNVIVLVVGVNPLTDTIAWARANTGMPVGNEAMFLALKDQLSGVAFTPTAVFGTTRAQVTRKSGGYGLHYTIGSGVAAQIVMKQQPFLRACMNCESARDKKFNKGSQGYVYLKTELPLPTWGVIVTILIDLVILAAACAIVLWLDGVLRKSASSTTP